jgi:hypothetical protein
MFAELCPRSEIDVVVDLTSHERPSAEDLNPLFM